jgi:hypothetical protein
MDQNEGKDHDLDNLVMEEEDPPVLIPTEEEFILKEDEQKPYVIEDDHELNKTLKVITTQQETMDELKGHLDQVCWSWKTPRDRTARNFKGSEVYKFFNKLLEDKHRPILIKTKLTIITMYTRCAKRILSTDQWKLSAMIRNITLLRKTSISATISEFDNMLYIATGPTEENVV